MRAATLLTAVLVAAAALPAFAQQAGPVPPELEGVGITERLNEPLPLELTFRDEDGKPVALGSFFEPDRPVVLSLVYFDCPMLCNVFLDGFTRTLQDLDWTPGQEFRVVTVSIDPEDGPEGARAKRERYVEELGRPEAAEGWHFLTGDQEEIGRLADALGFRYRLDEDSGEYMHSAGLFLATPDGRISRTLYGVTFDPRTLRLSLVEASGNGIGTAMDRILLFCFAYDHTEGRYGPAAMNLMRGAASLTVLALGVFLAGHWRRDTRRSPSLGARA